MKEEAEDNNNRPINLPQGYTINYFNPLETNLSQTPTAPHNPNLIIHNKYLSNTIFVYIRMYINFKSALLMILCLLLKCYNIMRYKLLESGNNSSTIYFYLRVPKEYYNA